MTCAEVLRHLEDWPAIREEPAWGAVVRHTWDCPSCRAELVGAVVLAERVRAALEALPDPPERVRRAVLGGAGLAGSERETERPAHHSPRARLALAGPHLPLLVRLAVDPLALVAPWLPVPSAR